MFKNVLYLEENIYRDTFLNSLRKVKIFIIIV